MQKSSNVLIIGAGKAGRLLLDELKSPNYKEYFIQGFIDDDEKKFGTSIENIRILGKTSQIPEIVKKEKINLCIIAIPSIQRENLNRILSIIQRTKSNFMIVPPIFENLKINSIAKPRKIEVDDLLRSPTENVLTEKAMKELQNNIFLVTGVAGSIGSKICNQLASCSPKRIMGLDKAETPLFEISNSMKEDYPDVDFVPILCNIKEKENLQEIINQCKPDIIYHCAAFKHVGLMENFPLECVKNNIEGSINLMKAAKKSKVERFVFVSTDKAVYPTSVMGMSKRIIEKYILSEKDTHTKFMIVRFGNVIESNGSVIPIFKKQIEKGGPILLTDKRMERYFMTITEAAQLVIQASILGSGGELFILDMGEPYKIKSIIDRLLQLYSLDKDDIEIRIIGKRKGEKLSEKLFYEFEGPTHSQHNRILKCQYENDSVPENFRQMVEEFSIDVKDLIKEEIREKLENLVE
ncbi:GDP-L-fucose synthase [subsurface metagenome]